MYENFRVKLERAVSRSSERGVLCLVARARVSSLERAFLRSSELRGCRPEASSFWLERAFLRSSEDFLCLVARATKSSLERAFLCKKDRGRLGLRSNLKNSGFGTLGVWVIFSICVLRSRMSTRGSRGRLSSRNAGRGTAVPLAPAVAASAVGEVVASEIVRAVQDALARTEGGSGHALKLTKEFFRSGPPEFVGEAKPLKAESWLEQITKTLDMLRVEDEELRVSLATFQLKSDASYWWKNAKNNVGSTWVAFTEAFLAKYFPPSARERLRDQFLELRQDDTPVAQFEMRFASLSRFAPELVATEERRCFEFERRLCFDIREKVAGSFWKDYYYLVKAAAHMEAMVASDVGVKEETIAVSSSVPKHSRLSKGWRRKHTQSGAGSFSSSGVADSSVGRSGEVQVSDQSQGRGSGGCFICGQQGHGRRFCPLRVNSSSVSKPSQTQSYPSSRGRFRYQKRAGQASGASRGASC
ncbi:hypothetical protein HYC85_028757 [Camellia sinensis]|uniref:CCHC-type domain-containing protein n=1 Tax=Camellia sinensis TaxID=4442 RepID=A0A7J7G014_CAMSI|nr:hypothetical protein HYC85_028757 [Camellia sinensis]